MPRRVLILTPSAAPGGAERAFVSVARRLHLYGWEPHAISLEDGPAVDDLRRVGCAVEIIRPHRARNLPSTIAAVLRIARRARGVDLVLSNQSKGHVYGGVAARLARRPAVFWQQVIPTKERFDGLAAHVPARVVMCSSEDAVAAQLRLAPRSRVRKVHLGIELDDVVSQAGEGGKIRAQLGWTQHKVVGIVGRLEEWKGQRDFIAAAAAVSGTRPDVRFLVVGGSVLSHQTGAYERGLHEQVHKLGIEGNVRFVGHQEDIYPWYDALDVAVNATYGEPFGLVLIEAMALGVPLVATAAGGPLEIIEDGVSGLLVPVGDPSALAGAIMRILDDEALATSLSDAARERARHFSAERMTERVVDVLETVTNQRPSSS